MSKNKVQSSKKKRIDKLEELVKRQDKIIKRLKKAVEVKEIGIQTDIEEDFVSTDGYNEEIIKSKDSKIKELNKRIEILEKKLINLQSNIDENKLILYTRENNNLEIFNSNIKELMSNIEFKNEQINDLKKKMNDLVSRNHIYKKTISELEKKIHSWKIKYKNLENEYTINNNTHIKQYNNIVLKVIEEQKKEIEQLRYQIYDTSLDGNYNLWNNSLLNNI